MVIGESSQGEGGDRRRKRPVRKGWQSLPLASVALTLVTGLQGGSAVPAPQDSKIVFLRLIGGFWQLWLMNSDGSHERQLTRTPVDKVHSAWRPGNREILYHTNRGETFLLEAGTGRERRILEGIAVRDAAWSPDGKTLAYGLPPEDKLNGKETLWISALQGRDRRQVAGAFGIDALAPIWLDGRRLLYRQCSMRDNMAVGHDFWMLDVDRVHFRNAVPGDDEPLKFDQSLSPEGILAYSSLQSGFYEIWTLDLEGGKARQLTHLEAYSGNPTWSPDGKSLAFESNKDGRTQIYRLDANGEGLKQLTRNEAPSRKPVWTPPATLARSGAQ